MRRLILDYYRRWWLPITACIIAEIFLGISVQGLPNSPLEFWGFMVALWSGAILYIFDYSHGIRLGLVILPFTDRQIGVAWFLQTLIIPFLAMAFCLTFGAAISYVAAPDNGFHIIRLLKYIIINFSWLGAVALPSLIQIVYTNPRSLLLMTRAFPFVRYMGYGLFGLLGQLPMFGTLLLCQNTVTNPLKFTLFMALGILYAVIMWYFAVNYFTIPFTGSPHIKSSTFKQVAKIPAVFNVKGRGGIPYLIKSVFLQESRTTLTTLGSMFILTLFFHFSKTMPVGTYSWATICSYIISFVFLIGTLSGILFIIQQLRLLRSLPISSMQLVTILFGLLLLPNLILSFLLFLFLHLSPFFILSCLFAYGVVSLFTCFMINSQAKHSNALLSGFIGILIPIVLMFPEQINQHDWNPIHSVVTIVLALATLIGFLFSWLSLKSSSKPYRN